MAAPSSTSNEEMAAPSSTSNEEMAAPSSTSNEDVHLLASTEVTIPVEPQTLTEFTLFPQLLAEVRSLIWVHAAQIPRIVEFPDHESCRTQRDLHSSTAPPAVLHVNRESRWEAMRRGGYRLIDCPIAPGWLWTDRKFYFNPLVDTALMPVINAWALSQLRPSEDLFQHVQKLAFRLGTPDDATIPGLGRFIVGASDRFSNLEELNVVVPNDYHRQIDQMDTLVEDDDEEHQNLVTEFWDEAEAMFRAGLRTAGQAQDFDDLQKSCKKIVRL